MEYKMNKIILEGLGNHYTKQVTKYEIKINDIINIGQYSGKCKVIKITNNYIKVYYFHGNYNQKLTLNNLFTPIKKFKELKDSYIIKDKKDQNFGKDFRYIPIKY
tara:strand:- start:582 stop:896 length:315 start_codon:yes stop_codon:yes gene_type:complete